MADDMGLLTEDDKRHTAYQMCVVGTSLVGGALGAITTGFGAPLGAAAGFVLGRASCPYLAEPLKKKLFSRNDKLSDGEFKQVLSATKRSFPQASKSDILKMIAMIKVQAHRLG